MAGFDYSNPTHRKIRRYRTLAIKAALYAQRPAYASVRSSWVYLAQSWTDLADIKERANRWDAARATPPPPGFIFALASFPNPVSGSTQSQVVVGSGALTSCLRV